MKRLIGMFAALCLLPFLPDSRLLAAVIGGGLGIVLGGVVARAVLRALGVAHPRRASTEKHPSRELANRRIGALAALAIMLGGCIEVTSTAPLGPPPPLPPPLPPPPGAPPPATSDPGALLGVPAPYHDNLLDWDMLNSRLIASRTPGFGGSTIVAIDLESRRLTDLGGRAEQGIQMIQVAAKTSAIIYSTSEPSVIRLGTGPLASTTRVQFFNSADERWLVVNEGAQWVLLDRASGVRHPLGAISRTPMAIDAHGEQVAFGLVRNPFVKSIEVVTVSTGTVRSIPLADALIWSVAFVDDRVHALVSRWSDAGNGRSRATFTELAEGSAAEQPVGAVDYELLNGPSCVGWSWSTRTAVAVMRPAGSGYQIVGMALGITSSISTAAVNSYPIACTLSPDGKWFAYGNGTGYSNTSTLYLKRMP